MNVKSLDIAVFIVPTEQPESDGLELERADAQTYDRAA